MSDDAKNLPLHVAKDSREPHGAAAPRQKAWAAPKVITSTLSEDTAFGASDGDDGSDHDS